MAVCSVCGKKNVSGNNVSHANNRTKRIFSPNLQGIKIQTKHGVRRTPSAPAVSVPAQQKKQCNQIENYEL